MMNESDQEEYTKAQIRHLNEEFYSNFNAKYFRQKISYLMANLADTSFISNQYEKGIEIGDIKAKGEKLTDEEDVNLKELLKSEIAITYYHAIETFFRLFIAHFYRTKCPWVEISDLKSYQKFKEEVTKIRDGKFPKEGSNLAEVICNVMYGSKPPESSNVEENRWKDSITNLTSWITQFASDILQNEDYNAYKHGLGLFTTKIGFEMPGTPIKELNREALVYITQERVGDEINYSKTYKFVDWEQKTALIFKVSEMIDNIIKIGRGRYLGVKEPISLRLFHDIKPIDVFKEGIHTNSISMQLPFSKKINKNAKKEKSGK